MSLFAIWVITATLLLLGLLGVFMPALPGIALVFIGILFFAWATNFSSISLTTVIILGFLTLFAWLIEYLGSIIGAKFGGGEKYSIIGSIAGGAIGFLSGGPIGIIIGAVAGVMLGALYEGKNYNQAGKAALFSIIGIFGANIIQFFLAIMIITAFLLAVLL